MPHPKLNPDRWIIAYQEPGGSDLKFSGHDTERQAEMTSRALMDKGCKIHAVRTQVDVLRAMLQPLKAGG